MFKNWKRYQCLEEGGEGGEGELGEEGEGRGQRRRRKEGEGERGRGRGVIGKDFTSIMFWIIERRMKAKEGDGIGGTKRKKMYIYSSFIFSRRLWT